MKLVILILSLLSSLDSFGQTASKERVDYICSSVNEKVDGQQVLTNVDTPPAYSGGMTEIYEMLAKGLTTPLPDEPTKVYISYIVDTKGDLRDFCVKRHNDDNPMYTLEADAIRVFKLLGKWTPGKHQGKTVPVRMTLPIIVTIRK